MILANKFDRFNYRTQFVRSFKLFRMNLIDFANYPICNINCKLLCSVVVIAILVITVTDLIFCEDVGICVNMAIVNQLIQRLLAIQVLNEQIKTAEKAKVPALKHDAADLFNVFLLIVSFIIPNCLYRCATRILGLLKE